MEQKRRVFVSERTISALRAIIDIYTKPYNGHALPVAWDFSGDGSCCISYCEAQILSTEMKQLATADRQTAVASGCGLCV